MKDNRKELTVMKKIILNLITLAMCLCLCACNQNNGSGSTDNNQNVNLKSVLFTKDGVVSIKYNKFGKLIERIELTTDNWKDYVKVYSYEEKRVSYDAFGEVVSTEVSTLYTLGPGNERYYQFYDAVIELKDKNTGELVTYYLTPEADEITQEFNLDNYDCTRIKGILYFVNLPKEALHSPLPMWNYATGFQLASDGMTEPYRVNTSSKIIDRNGSGSWDHFLK